MDEERWRWNWRFVEAKVVGGLWVSVVVLVVGVEWMLVDEERVRRFWCWFWVSRFWGSRLKVWRRRVPQVGGRLDIAGFFFWVGGRMEMKVGGEGFWGGEKAGVM